MDQHQTHVTRVAGPEDLRPGDYVTILAVTVESLPFIIDHSMVGSWVEPARARLLPGRARVLRVRAVCVPLVLVKQPFGGRAVFDLRRYALGRLDPQFGREAFKALRPPDETPPSTDPSRAA